TLGQLRMNAALSHQGDEAMPEAVEIDNPPIVIAVGQGGQEAVALRRSGLVSARAEANAPGSGRIQTDKVTLHDITDPEKLEFLRPDYLGRFSIDPDAIKLVPGNHIAGGRVGAADGVAVGKGHRDPVTVVRLSCVAL